MMKKTIAFALLTISIAIQGIAKEGMWIPSLVKNLVESDMKNMGMKLSAEDIYAFNKSSLKDAIIHFGGGCTAELISNQGLLLTNHHCGYSQIQRHSSLENDYLQDGFWAMSMEEELSNPGLTATRIVSIHDVTKEVLDSVTDGMPELARQQLVARHIKQIGDKATKGTQYTYRTEAFYYGNKYYMFLMETFKDVRLVGAPPSSIGKYGFDTDNWVWPRHTGDFSIFRIYADKDNKPAAYSEDNVPYKPLRHLDISLNGYKEGDFTMVYGFPGRTQEYIPASHVEYLVETSRPAGIAMRDASLSIIWEAMKEDPLVRIQYAAKQARISNAWKKWKGQLLGLEKAQAIAKRKAQEEALLAAAAKKGQGEAYRKVLTDYEKVVKEKFPYVFARELFIEWYYYGPEVFRYADGFNALAFSDTASNREEVLEKELKRVDGFFKNYNESIDKAVFKKMFKLYVNFMPDSLLDPETKALFESYKGDETIDKLYKKSHFSSPDKMKGLLSYSAKKGNKALQKDPIYVLVKSMIANYRTSLAGEVRNAYAETDLLMRTYISGLRELLPDERIYFPDANSTLRVSFGKVDGYMARDGVKYLPYTTLNGVIEKMDTSTLEFDVPQKLVELYNARDYGQYAENGELRVAFIASNHTTGGNSGSPALNAKGELIGLNFDRTWESTMSDIYYDPNICRNIMVDIRYVLFIVDKYAGAQCLIDEMSLVK